MHNAANPIESIFAEAIGLSVPAARAAYLDRACADDVTLCARVEMLLNGHEQAGSFMANADDATSAETLDFGRKITRPPIDVNNEKPGTVIGHYKLVQRLGEGGMGVVYMAEQHKPVRRRVALKIIKPGMDSAQVLARFEAERQALAMMDHPNIAKVLDVGTTDSKRPFFVMELVKGVPITQFCDERKLSPRQRLELFVPVCQAIQHAHMKGIIHRDIKPSNVLVAIYDDRPVAKVIDFGVAKATGQSLTDQTLMTGLGAVVGTPEYMSPEQASLDHLDVDTRSDIYSLGVLLYELLTGTTPVDRKSLGKAAVLEILRVVREVEAPRPSAKLSTIDALPSVAANRNIEPARLSKLMKGELDWILLKALEKDRTRRYETANGFAMDVQRYLSGEAVQAHPPSRAYQLKKFVRRNKGQVIAASLVLLALLAGVTGTSWGLVEARRHEQIARSETAEKEKARVAEAKRAEGERQAKQEAEAKRIEAKKQEAEAKRQEADAKKKLVRFRVATGTNAVERGELWEALVWYAKAWEDDTDRQNEPAHRMRIASTLNRAPKLMATFFHDMKVFDARLSSDGSRLVTLTEGGVETHLFNTATQGIVARLTPDTKVMAADFSGDGKLLATGSDDGIVRLWNPVDGSAAGKPVELASPIRRLVFHPSRPMIAVSTDESVLVLYDLKRRETIAVIDPLAATNPLDAKPGKPTATRSRETGGKEVQRHIAFSADGSRILAGADDQLRVWDAATGKPISPVLDCTRLINADSRNKSGPGFSPDGRRTVGVSEKQLAIMDVASGAVVCLLPNTDNGLVFLTAFSPDGKRVMVTSTPDHSTLQVFDSETGDVLHALAHPRSVLAAVWSSDSKRILSASAGGEIHLWDAQTAKELAPVNKHGLSTSRIAFSADGRQVLVADLDGTVRLWEYTPAEPLMPYDLADGRNPWDEAASLDGRFVLLKGATKGDVILGSARTGEPLGLPPFTIAGPVKARFSANGERILVVNAEGAGQVYETATGRAVGPASKSIPEKWVHCAALSPDGGHWAIGGTSSRAETYESATGRRLATVRHNYDVVALSFDATGQRLATCSYDRNARVWDTKTGAPVSPQLHHKMGVGGASFSPDGRWLVTSTGGEAIQLWDIRTGDPLGPSLIHPNTGKPWFDRDGRSIVFRDGEHYLRWKLPLFTAPADEVPLLAKLYSGRYVDETDGISTIDRSEFINSHQRYRQAWFASLGREIPAVPAPPSLAATAPTIEPGSVVPLEVALKSVGKTVTVEYTVESVGRTKAGGWVLLNSKKDITARDNLEAAIRNGTTREEEFGVKQELVGQRIRVSGTVGRFQGRTQIIVENKSQLEILPPTESPVPAVTPPSVAGAAVSPEVALQTLGKTIVVEFTVANVGSSNGGWFYLNSKDDYQSKDNLTVAIRNGTTREEEFGLKENLVGRKVRVTGVVALFKERKEIIVENKSQLEILPR